MESVYFGVWTDSLYKADVSSVDFYYWGSLNDKMYKTNLHSLDELWNNIHHDISTISIEEPQRFNNNAFRG